MMTKTKGNRFLCNIANTEAKTVERQPKTGGEEAG
jgi:hypothetical protein